jgi:glutamate synthase domain-containing protein 1
MCAITGFLDKTGHDGTEVGKLLLRMLLAVGCRGPDSTGMAVYGPHREGVVLQVKLGENGDFAALAEVVTEIVGRLTPVREARFTFPYLRLVVDSLPDTLVFAIEAVASEVEVVSAGRRLEIVKQVGSPAALEDAYGVSRLTGTHGIGHTRLSTESRIDLSHSQPFWAHGCPDVATAHNGHITNYHKMRRLYEQRGIRFYTENDSEIIGIYLNDRMGQGATFEEALQASLVDFDGAFSYVAATENALAYVKDPFGLKPLVVAETDDWVAIATEEIALRQAFGGEFDAREPGTRRSHVWRLPQRVRVNA